MAFSLYTAEPITRLVVDLAHRVEYRILEGPRALTIQLDLSRASSQ